VFGFIVEQLFATKSGTLILPERGGDLPSIGISKLLSAQLAGALESVDI
jgi:hypothetical protein